LIENDAVRTSTEATFVLPTIVPSNQLPGRRVRVENQTRTMRGGSFGFAKGAAGIACGTLLETTRFGGTATGLAEQPVAAQSAPADNVRRALRKDFEESRSMTAGK
jgi:hypothetical protein